MLIKTITKTVLLFGLIGTASASNNFYSASSVWKVNEQQAFSAFMSCDTAAATCVAKKMQKLGASPDALKFSAALKYQGYLASFQEKGTVDLGTVIYPFRANTNSAYMLLNAQPNRVNTELNNLVGLEKDASFKQLKKTYKNLEFWGTNAKFVKLAKTKSGSNYIFNYLLKDGCRACDVPASAQVEFRFNSQGKYLGAQFVKIVK